MSISHQMYRIENHLYCERNDIQTTTSMLDNT